MQELVTASRHANFGFQVTTVGDATGQAQQTEPFLVGVVTTPTGSSEGQDTGLLSGEEKLDQGQSCILEALSAPPSFLEKFTTVTVVPSYADFVPGSDDDRRRASEILSKIENAGTLDLPNLTGALVDLGPVGLQSLYELFFRNNCASVLQEAIISHCDNIRTLDLGQKILQRIISNETIITDKNAAHYCELMAKIVRGAYAEVTSGGRYRPDSSLDPVDELAVHAVKELPLNVAALMLKHMSATGPTELVSENSQDDDKVGHRMVPLYLRMREAFLKRPELGNYSLGQILDHQEKEGPKETAHIALAREYLLNEARHRLKRSNVPANTVDRMKFMLRKSTIDSNPFGAFTLLTRDWYPDQLASHSKARECLFHLNACSPEDLSQYFGDFRDFRRAVGATWEREFEKMILLLKPHAGELTEDQITNAVQEKINRLRDPLDNIAQQDPAIRNRELAQKILDLQDTLRAWKDTGYVERFLTGYAVFGLNRDGLSRWQRFKLLLAATLA